VAQIIAGTSVTVVNLDELADEIVQAIKDGITVNVGDVSVDTTEIEDLLTQINNKIPSPIDLAGLENVLNNLNISITNLTQKLGIIGDTKIYGMTPLQIPAMTNDYTISFTVIQNGYLTDVTYSLSAWNYEDNWDLLINDNKIFSNITTKEYGENKHFENYRQINKNDTINIIFHNNSGSNKVLWVDLGLLEIEEETT